MRLMVSEILWKRLSEFERKKIEEDSKKLILEFGNSLEKLPVRKETSVERDKFEREELPNGTKCDNDFRKLMLENVQNHDEDSIIAEKGAWTK